jgi:hypothetical protein
MIYHPLTDDILEEVELLARPGQTSTPASVARQLMRLGYVVTVEHVEMVLSYLGRIRVVEPEPEPPPKPARSRR